MKHRHGAASLGVGLLAVGLAGLGEAVIRSKNFSGLGGALYLLGIILFAIGAWPIPWAPGDPSSAAESSRVPSTGPSAAIPQASQGERRRRGRWRGTALLIFAVVVAIGANVVMLSRLRRG